MKRVVPSLILIAMLAGCGAGQPLFDTDDTTTDTTDDSTDDGGLTTDGTPPGTANPTTESSIYRYEAVDTDTGGGYATGFAYNNDSGQDELTITGLAFDGDDTYSRGAIVSSLNGYSVYDADISVPDFLDGDSVGQLTPYRAILGLSDNEENGGPRTSFAVVRTGGYIGYGFGGFVYQREGGVVIPNNGFALYTGDYAGLRIFEGQSGLEYTVGDVELSFDFAGFGDGAVVRGSIFNRIAYDSTGGLVALDVDPSNGICDGCLILPDIVWMVQAGSSVLDENGEISGGLISFYTDENGETQTYEEGEFYAILAGDTTDPTDGGEVVGVIVVTSTDLRNEVSAQEAGGFILYRSD